VKYSKLISWIVCFVCIWLAFGAASLHQKDIAAGVRETSPAYHTMQTPLVLGVFALIFAAIALFAKTGAGAKAPTRLKL
jgi:hypothetical protein